MRSLWPVAIWKRCVIGPLADSAGRSLRVYYIVSCTDVYYLCQGIYKKTTSGFSPFYSISVTSISRFPEPFLYIFILRLHCPFMPAWHQEPPARPAGPCRGRQQAQQ